MTHHPAAPLWMLGASLGFACMAAAVKLAANHGVPLGHILFYRGLVSLLMMSVWMGMMRVSMLTPHWKAHVQRGSAGVIGMIAYFAGITMLPLASAVTLNYTSPLLLATILLFMHRERPPTAMVVAMLSGFVGILLLLQPSYDNSQWVGVACALGSAFTAAIAALNIRSLGRLEEPIPRTVAFFSLFVTLGSIPLYITSDPVNMDLTGAAYVIAVGVFATLAQVLLTLAYQRGHTLTISLLGYSQVVFTSLIGIVLWNDHPALSSWLAMALIIASGAAATKFTRTGTSARA